MKQNEEKPAPREYVFRVRQVAHNHWRGAMFVNGLIELMDNGLTEIWDENQQLLLGQLGREMARYEVLSPTADLPLGFIANPPKTPKFDLRGCAPMLQQATNAALDSVIKAKFDDQPRIDAIMAHQVEQERKNAEETFIVNATTDAAYGESRKCPPSMIKVEVERNLNGDKVKLTGYETAEGWYCQMIWRADTLDAHLIEVRTPDWRDIPKLLSAKFKKVGFSLKRWPSEITVMEMVAEMIDAEAHRRKQLDAAHEPTNTVDCAEAEEDLEFDVVEDILFRLKKIEDRLDRAETECPECEGHGEDRYSECKKCGGTGKIPISLKMFENQANTKVGE